MLLNDRELGILIPEFLVADGRGRIMWRRKASLFSRFPGLGITVLLIIFSGHAAAGGAPDLVIDSILVDPEQWFLEQSVYVQAEVLNDGDGSSSATVTDFYLSTDSVIDTGDQDFGNFNVPALEPAETWVPNLETVLTPEPGTYWIGVCVRPVEGESNIDNNCSDGVQVQVQENDNICTIVPLNCGSQVATSLTPQDCDDGPSGPNYYAKVHTFEGLAGTDVAIAAEWEGDGYLFLESPSGEVVAFNDDEGDIFHSLIEYTLDASGTWIAWASTFDELETFAYEIGLSCESVPVVDLAVTEIDVDPLVVEPGADLTITAVTANLGTIASTGTTLRYFRSPDASITTADAPIGSDTIGPLDGGEETEDNLLVSAPGTPSVYFYGACVDELEGEQSSENNCSSAVQVTVQSGEAIPITAGLNDAWFNPATNGQGFFFNVFPGLEQIFVGWFTYDLELPEAAAGEGLEGTANIGGANQRWLTAFGDFAPTLGGLDLYSTSGGVFNSAEPPVTEAEVGTFEVSFDTCSLGTVVFDIPSANVSGEIPIQRISDDNVALCEELAGSNPSNVLSTFEIDPLQVPVDQDFTVSWTTDGATECTPEYGTGGWANLEIDPAGGNARLSPDEPGLHVFDLTCTAPGESVTRRARVLATACLLCDPPPPPVPFQISEGLNDAWYNPDTSGQGFFINVFPGRKELFLAWFTYDTERPDGGAMADIGEPGHRWFTAFGGYDNNEASLALEVTTGGVFNDAPPSPQSTIGGSIDVEFIDCENAIVDFNITSANLVGEIPIRRITNDNLALCEELSGGAIMAQ